MSIQRIPSTGDIMRRPEIASIATLITQIDIGRRALIASQPLSPLSRPGPHSISHSRLCGIDIRAFNLQIDLEYLLRDIFAELDASFDE